MCSNFSYPPFNFFRFFCYTLLDLSFLYSDCFLSFSLSATIVVSVFFVSSLLISVFNLLSLYRELSVFNLFSNRRVVIVDINLLQFILHQASEKEIAQDSSLACAK